MDEKYTGLKKQLSELCSLKPEQILLAEVHASNIKVSTHFYMLLLKYNVSFVFLLYFFPAILCFLSASQAHIVTEGRQEKMSQNEGKTQV